MPPPGRAAAPAWRTWLPGLPVAVLAGWWVWHWAVGVLALDLWHLLLGVLTAAAALLARRLYTPAALTLLLAAPLAHHFLAERPAVLALAGGGGAHVRIEGTVRGREALYPEGGRGVLLRLGDAVIHTPRGRAPLADLEVALDSGSPWAFPYRGRVSLGGRPKVRGIFLSGAQGATLRLPMTGAENHRLSEPARAGGGEALRARLRDRAAYYLSPSALAVYLPVLLGLRERGTPEARRVTRAFRRVGVAHLFAISGLHVGLLYLLCFGVLRWARAGWVLAARRGTGGVFAQGGVRLTAAVAVWAYIALIGFPTPAVRAALMGSLLIWNGQWGLRTSPFLLLLMAGLLLLGGDPSLFYDLSYQLSFLAYFFLVFAIKAWRPGAVRGGPERFAGAWRRMASAGLLNLWMTLMITLGLWPLSWTVFGQVSLLVFAGNLLMVPLMGLLVLPAGLAGLAASLISLDAPPGGVFERAAFSLLDPLLRAWVWLVEGLESWGGSLVISGGGDWNPRWTFVYYAALLLILWLLTRRGRRRGAD